MQTSATVPATSRLGERGFVCLMAALQALQAFSIDSMLPALGTMSHDLGVADANQRQLVIGIFLIGGGFGSLIPGTLADRYGRRPVLLGCLGCFVVLTLACALVRDFTTLLILRGLIGFTSAGLSVLPGAIIRDRMQGDKMARMQSLVSMMFMLVPMIAPTIGQAIQNLAGWRWIFGAMALAGVLVGGVVWARLEETLHPEYRQEITARVIVSNLGTVLFNRAAAGYVIGFSLVLGALFGYINSAQQLMVEHFQIGDRFPLVFGAMALAMSVSSFTNASIVERFGARRVSQTALIAFFAVALVQLWLASSPGETAWQFVPVMAINMCLIGFIGANFGSISLQPFETMAGAAASVQSFVRMIVASLLGALIGQGYDGTARPIAMALCGSAIITLGLVLWSEHGKLFRRLYPAGTPRASA